jgi:hypothetical protein
MNAAATIDDRTVTEDARVLVGDDYDQSAEWTIERVAEALHHDLLAVQCDEMFPEEVEFAITTETSGPQDLIRVTTSGLYRHVEYEGFPGAYAAYTVLTEQTRVALASVFELASNYNRVDPAHPDQARFVVVIEIADDGNTRPALVGVMQDMRPFPPLGGACPNCARRDTVDEEPATTPA